MDRPIRRHRERHNRSFNALRTVSVALEVLLALGLVWLVWTWFGSSVLSRSARGISNNNNNRFCVDMLRHRVQPITPALASEDAKHEPWAIGWLDVNVARNELSRRITDSLNTIPHDLTIRGPLEPDSASGVAPVYVRLGTTRDASGKRLAGQLEVERVKVLALHSQPSKFYISVSEWRKNGDTRELARCPLDALPRVC